MVCGLSGTLFLNTMRSKWGKVFVWCPFIFTCKNLPIPLFQLIPVESFTHLCNDLSTDMCGKSVCLWRVREVADPSSKWHNMLKLRQCREHWWIIIWQTSKVLFFTHPVQSINTLLAALSVSGSPPFLSLPWRLASNDKNSKAVWKSGTL